MKRLELPGILSGFKSKVCSMCRQQKALSQFNRHGDRPSTYCRLCQRKYSKAHYRRNKELHNSRRYLRTRTSRRQLQQFVRGYMRTKACIDCGEGDTVVLELDHVRGVKKGAISALIQRGCTLNVIKAELQ